MIFRMFLEDALIFIDSFYKKRFYCKIAHFPGFDLGGLILRAVRPTTELCIISELVPTIVFEHNSPRFFFLPTLYSSTPVYI